MLCATVMANEFAAEVVMLPDETAMSALSVLESLSVEVATPALKLKTVLEPKGVLCPLTLRAVGA